MRLIPLKENILIFRSSVSAHSVSFKNIVKSASAFTVLCYLCTYTGMNTRTQLFLRLNSNHAGKFVILSFLRDFGYLDL